MAQRLVEETRQADQGGAGAAAAPQAPAQALPPLVVRPALAEAVRQVIAAEQAYQALDAAFMDDSPSMATPEGRGRFADVIAAERLVHEAIVALEREVAGEADDAAQP